MDGPVLDEKTIVDDVGSSQWDMWTNSLPWFHSCCGLYSDGRLFTISRTRMALFVTEAGTGTRNSIPRFLDRH
jgi:hypothetical protein